MTSRLETYRVNYRWSLPPAGPWVSSAKTTNHLWGSNSKRATRLHRTSGSYKKAKLCYPVNSDLNFWKRQFKILKTIQAFYIQILFFWKIHRMMFKIVNKGLLRKNYIHPRFSKVVEVYKNSFYSSIQALEERYRLLKSSSPVSSGLLTTVNIQGPVVFY